MVSCRAEFSTYSGGKRAARVAGGLTERMRQTGSTGGGWVNKKMGGGRAKVKIFHGIGQWEVGMTGHIFQLRQVFMMKDKRREMIGTILKIGTVGWFNLNFRQNGSTTRCGWTA